MLLVWFFVRKMLLLSGFFGIIEGLNPDRSGLTRLRSPWALSASHKASTRQAAPAGESELKKVSDLLGRKLPILP